MDQVTLSVSQLRCACIDPEWLQQYLAGGNPSTFTPSKSGTKVHGTDFHALAEKFIDWAVDPRNAAQAFALDNDDGVASQLRALGADELVEKWLAENDVDSAAVFMEALYNFGERLIQLRRSKPQFKSWSDIYLGQEVSIQDALVYSGDRAVFVSGVIDSLRVHHAGEVEIVDYKLSHGHELEKELVQLAIYQKLLCLKRPGFTYRGCIEYLLPHLHVQDFTENDLHAIYKKWVDPILPLLANRAKGKGARVSKPDQPQESSKSSAILRLGHDRTSKANDLMIPLKTLTRHSAILGGSGSGKTTLALYMVEQALLQGISVLLVDRKGDLCRYADPAAWNEPVDDPKIAARRAELRGAFDVALYTPGYSSGRPLGIRVVPLAQDDPAEMDQACRSAATALGGILGLGARPTDQPKLAILTSAIRVLCKTRREGDLTLDDLVLALTEPTEELSQVIGPLDSKHVRKLVEAVQTLKILQGDLLGSHQEKLDASAFFSQGKKPKLSIIVTKFLGDKATTQFWVTQLLIELGRFAAKFPSPELQGLAMFDEADLYLPAVSRPPTKEPMENLLRRARSAGLGILLATQSPGDFDYKCKENVLNWLVGLVKERTALEKLRPMFGDDRLQAFESISQQRTGQFILLQEGSTIPFVAPRSAIETMQLGDQDILRIARNQLS